MGKKALACKDFLSTNIDTLPADGMNHTLHGPDEEAGFSIRAFSYAKDKAVGIPHDHGGTWAIYGEAVGVTKMEDWKVVEPATKDESGKTIPGKIECVRRYEVKPGEAYLYDVGDVHATSGEANPSRSFLQVVGSAKEARKRTPLKPI